jgi:hypothetical protein
MSFFRICFAATLIVFVAIGLFHRHNNHPIDPIVTVIGALRAAGHTVTKPTTTLWGVPSVAVSVDGCDTPVNIVPFDFDGIASPGVLQAALVAEHAKLRIDYAGRTFESFDRAVLYRLRFQSDVAQLIRTHDLDEPPVILSFWPSACTPKNIF